MKKLLGLIGLLGAVAAACTTTSTTTEDGDGGDASTSSSTGTSTGTTSTGTTGSTVTSTGTGTSTGQGGGGGEGGSSGQGGANPCADLAFDLVYDGFDSAAYYSGVPTPGIGQADEDVVYLDLYSATLTGAVDLGAGDNASFDTCEACLYAFEDIVDEVPTKAYFQSEGTLDLGATTVFYIAGEFTGVTLVEVDPDTALPISGGSCLTIAAQSFQIDPPTTGWTCPPDYYDVADGCDCACGAADPDCEDAEAEVFGCTSGSTCSATGECEGGVPWSCDVDYYDADDGCDCECGSYDPDCDADNTSPNCDAGEICDTDGTCVTAP